jgi:hypothetical protein
MGELDKDRAGDKPEWVYAMTIMALGFFSTIVDE